MIVGSKNIIKILTKILNEYDIKEEIRLSYTDFPDFDIQCNNLVKYANHKNIDSISSEIISELENDKRIEKINISDKFFVNIKFSNNYLYKYSFFDNEFLQKEELNILIDYGGPNIGKALHVGHLRTLNIGRSLYNTNKFVGNNIISDIHFGDWGMPIAQILAYIEENDIEIDSLHATDLEQIYPDANKLSAENKIFYEKAKNISNELNKENNKYKNKWTALYTLSVEEIKKLLTRLGHDFDYFYGESDVVKETEIVLKNASSNNLVRKDAGALVSTEKVDPPIILVKSDGSYLYLTTDLGTVYFREQNFSVDKYLYVVDLRQSNHFSQVFSTVKYFQLSSKEFFHVSYGTVNGKDGKPLKTRDGGTYKLEDLFTEIYKQLELHNKDSEIISCLTNSVLTYSDLLPNRKINYQFDIEKFTDINGKTAIYLQYAQVRAKKLIEEAKSVHDIQDLIDLNTFERDLAVKLTKFTSYISIALEKYEPHHLAEYTYDLAKSFNTFYTNCKIFAEDVSEKDKQKRIFLVRAFHKTIQDLFFCLGVTPVKEM